jgi:hypothetical protein
VAQQKQLIKLGLPASSTVSVLPKIKPASDTSTSPTKVNALQASASGRDGREARGLPELPSPGIREDGSKAGAMIDADGRVTNVTYAVSIYPYLADRQDEFDVAVYVFPFSNQESTLTMAVELPSSSSPRQRDGTLSRKIPMEWAGSFLIKLNLVGSLLVCP